MQIDKILVETQCEGIWAGGPTPCQCIKGMIEGFKAYRSQT